jgi:hypothetical protein
VGICEAINPQSRLMNISSQRSRVSITNNANHVTRNLVTKAQSQQSLFNTQYSAS